MSKPQIQKEVAIASAWADTRIIIFWATKDALEELKEYGYIWPGDSGKNSYWLKVDGRYDFNEVVEYIRNY